MNIPIAYRKIVKGRERRSTRVLRSPSDVAPEVPEQGLHSGSISKAFLPNSISSYLFLGIIAGCLPPYLFVTFFS